jgi:hypothetical protein
VKKAWIFLLVVIVVVILLLRRCGSGGGGVQLVVGQLGVSVWTNGTVAIAIPVENRGTKAAGDVHLTGLGASGGTRTQPATLPVKLGEIVPHRRAVAQATFTGLSNPGNHTLTVSGTYVEGGATHNFTATAPVALRPPATGPIPSVPVTAPTHKTTGTPTPPSPILPEVEDNNQPGPPVPSGQLLTPHPVPPSHTNPVKAPPPGQTAGGVRFIADSGRNSGINNAPPDPSTAVASSAQVVVQTDNSYLMFSKDDGATFTNVDPTTIFPQSDGGLCCDQVVLYHPGKDLIFWLLQYAGGTNRLRLAWASPASMKTNINAWTYLDLTQGLLNSGGSFDYPDLAFSDSYVYVSVNGQNSSASQGGLVVSRWSLADITAGSGNVGGAIFGPNESADQARAWGSHLAHNSSDGTYWAGHVDRSHIEVFHWPDTSGSITPHQTAINTWCSNSTSDYSNLSPDNLQWPDTGHLGGAGNIVAATRQQGPTGASGKVWFGWGAGKDCAAANQGRPLPFVKLVQVDDASLDSIGEYHIWNASYAFSYPALASGPGGDIGVSVAFAGPSSFPSTTVGYLNDYIVYYVEASDVSLKFYLTNTTPQTFTFTNSNDGTLVTDAAGNPTINTRYGDYFHVRNSGLRGELMSSQGYAVKLNNASVSTTCLSPPGCTYHPHYQQWGRATQGPR